MVRRIITIILLLGIAAAAAWALWPRPVAVETGAVERHDITLVVEDEGKSRIREVFTVSSPIAGRLLRVNLHAGDAVVENETVVASISPADPGLLDARMRRVAEAAVEAARASVDLSAAELRQAEAQLVFLKSELDRAIKLVRQGTISERAFEKAKLDVETAGAAVESARAMLMVRRRELERAEAALIETGSDAAECCETVKAPVSGRVLRVLAESEQVVQAGTALLEIGDPADLEIMAEILSRDAVKIGLGAKAIIDGWGGPPLTATVSRIDPSAVTKVSALGIEEQRVPVVLTLDGPPAQWAALGHGFRVVARIEIWKGEALVAIPISALFRQGAGWAAYVVTDGRAALRSLTIGARNSEWAEVKDGVTAGESVILHPSDQVADGVAVTVNAH